MTLLQFVDAHPIFTFLFVAMVLRGIQEIAAAFRNSSIMKNPSAFPQPSECWPNDGGQGMTLRDYFAAAALTGILANPDSDFCAYEERHAEAAFTHADAMLAKREKGQLK